MKRRMGVGVGVILLRNGSILLGKRNSDPEKASSVFHSADTWTLPGGKMDFGESFEDVARREVKEETGILAKDMKLISLTNDIQGDAHFVTVGFVCSDFSGEPKTLEPEEITEWKWFELENLPSSLYFITKKIIVNYKEKVFYRL